MPAYTGFKWEKEAGETRPVVTWSFGEANYAQLAQRQPTPAPVPEPELQTLIASPMNMVELLEVTDAFQLSGIGLTLMPDFPVPANGWKSTSLAIELLTPEGSVMAARAQFNITHFNIKDPNAGVERRWRVVATLPELHKSQVPIGTRLYLCQASSKLGCSSPDSRVR